MKLLSMALLCVAFGCVSTSSKTSGTPPSFALEDERLFDNGLDEVQAPSIVDGLSTGIFEQRVARADSIALVRIQYANAHVDFEHRSSYLLQTETLSSIRGEVPASIVLRVRDGQAGFESIRRSEEDLTGLSWVAFIKWEPVQGASELRPRWHLSPNSTRVLEKIAFLMQSPLENGETQVQVIRR